MSRLSRSILPLIGHSLQHLITLWACYYRGDTALQVIDIKSIVAVVAMVPLPQTDRYFVVEKPGLVTAHMAGNDEVISDE